MSERKKIVIVAPYRQDFLGVCRMEDWNPSEVIYADTADRLRGLDPAQTFIVKAKRWFKVDPEILERVELLIKLGAEESYE